MYLHLCWTSEGFAPTGGKLLLHADILLNMVALQVTLRLVPDDGTDRVGLQRHDLIVVEGCIRISRVARGLVSLTFLDACFGEPVLNGRSTHGSLDKAHRHLTTKAIKKVFASVPTNS